MTPKRILVVFHGNFLNHQIGCCSYVFEMVKYLKKQGCIVDFFSISNIWDNFDNFDELNAEYKLVDNLYLYTPGPDESCGMQKTIHESVEKTRYSVLGLPLFCKKDIRRSVAEKAEMDLHFGWVTPGAVKYFEKTVQENQYDVINIHYIQMAELAINARIPERCKLIYSAQDAMHMMEGYLKGGMGAMLYILPLEIEIMKRFDEILCISNDEKSFFERFLPGKILHHFPHALDPTELPEREKDIDALFLGFTNPHNVRGVIWLVNEVMPYVNKDVRVTICGKVWEAWEETDPASMKKALEYGIQRINFAEDLDELYSRTRFSICPLLGGTGMKIKVLDSLARGIPVVSTSWGVDGFADKHENGCLVSNDPREFAELINRMTADKDCYDTLCRQGKSYFAKYLSVAANSQLLNTAFGLDKEQ